MCRGVGKTAVYREIEVYPEVSINSLRAIIRFYGPPDPVAFSGSSVTFRGRNYAVKRYRISGLRVIKLMSRRNDVPFLISYHDVFDVFRGVDFVWMIPSGADVEPLPAAVPEAVPEPPITAEETAEAEAETAFWAVAGEFEEAIAAEEIAAEAEAAGEADIVAVASAASEEAFSAVAAETVAAEFAAPEEEIGAVIEEVPELVPVPGVLPGVPSAFPPFPEGWDPCDRPEADTAAIRTFCGGIIRTYLNAPNVDAWSGRYIGERKRHRDVDSERAQADLFLTGYLPPDSSRPGTISDRYTRTNRRHPEFTTAFGFAVETTEEITTRRRGVRGRRITVRRRRETFHTDRWMLYQFAGTDDPAADAVYEAFPSDLPGILGKFGAAQAAYCLNHSRSGRYGTDKKRPVYPTAHPDLPQWHSTTQQYYAAVRIYIEVYLRMYQIYGFEIGGYDDMEPFISSTPRILSQHVSFIVPIRMQDTVQYLADVYNVLCTWLRQNWGHEARMRQDGTIEHPVSWDTDRWPDEIGGTEVEAMITGVTAGPAGSIHPFLKSGILIYIDPDGPIPTLLRFKLKAVRMYTEVIPAGRSAGRTFEFFTAMRTMGVAVADDFTGFYDNPHAVPF